MRALLERSRSARAVVVALALGTVVALAHAASAGDDLGIRRDTLWPQSQPVAEFLPIAVPVRHHGARRIWAASRSRPLRITLARRGHRTRLVQARLAQVRLAQARRSRAPVKLAHVRPAAEPPVVFAKLITLPKPPPPALVSIYQDRTLRDGDAVMMADGIHVFHGAGQWPYRPRDFVRLTFVAALDWHLRQTLDVLDRNPPTRWSSAGSTAG